MQTIEEVTEDWKDIVLRPGMSMLAMHLKSTLDGLNAQLQSDTVDSFDKVCSVRGEINATRKIIHWVKAEYDRAAKGDTPEKKEQ